MMTKHFLDRSFVRGLLTAWLLAPANLLAGWAVRDSIPLDAVIVDLVKDPARPFLYAVNRTGSEVLFIDLELKTIKSIYVGKLPTGLAMNEAGDKLYVANTGPGTGTPGGYQIAVVDLNTQTKTHHFLTSQQPVNLAMGAGQRLYYNRGTWENGNIHNSGGNLGVINLATETEVTPASYYQIKSRMVMNPAKTKLYGQYVYDGNLGEMGVFDVETTTVFKLDRHPYSPYPYGWDYNNYSISGDGKRLAYGKVLFNANNLVIQYGVFSELIQGLNHDGSVAFGTNSIWDTTTFGSTGNATKLLQHGLASPLMHYDNAGKRLYAFTPNDYSIKILDTVEPVPAASDTDKDGLSDAEEATLGTDPTLADTDDDGLDDGAEVANGLNPLEADVRTPEMRALLTTLRRNPGELQMDTPLIWVEYGRVKLELQLWSGEGLADMSPLGSPTLFNVAKPENVDRQFYRIRAK
jgi:hypothetical protein